MDRLIDADRLLQETWKVETKDMFHITEMVEVVSAIDIKEAPTVEAEPVRYGHWVRNDNGTYSCSECHSWIPNEQHYYARYCLFCGAKMNEEEENEQNKKNASQTD